MHYYNRNCLWHCCCLSQTLHFHYHSSRPCWSLRDEDDGFTLPVWQFCCLSTAISTLDNKFDVWNCLLCSCCNTYAVRTSLPRPRSFKQPSLEYAILAKSLNITYVAIETIVHIQNQFDSRGQLIHTQLGHMHRSSPNAATRLAWQNTPNISFCVISSPGNCCPGSHRAEACFIFKSTCLFTKWLFNICNKSPLIAVALVKMLLTPFFTSSTSLPQPFPCPHPYPMQLSSSASLLLFFTFVFSSPLSSSTTTAHRPYSSFS